MEPFSDVPARVGVSNPVGFEINENLRLDFNDDLMINTPI